MKDTDTPYFVYILLCKDKTLYCGITTDILRRLQEHQKGIGAKYTRARGVEKIIHKEKFKNRSDASKRESAIKKLSKEEKLALCS